LLKELFEFLVAATSLQETGNSVQQSRLCLTCRATASGVAPTACR
jgi:hypothetical protein